MVKYYCTSRYTRATAVELLLNAKKSRRTVAQINILFSNMFLTTGISICTLCRWFSKAYTGSMSRVSSINFVSRTNSTVTRKFISHFLTIVCSLDNFLDIVPFLSVIEFSRNIFMKFFNMNLKSYFTIFTHRHDFT